MIPHLTLWSEVAGKETQGGVGEKSFKLVSYFKPVYKFDLYKG